MTENNELRIAVIGAGPAGVYSSDIFLRQLKKTGAELGLGENARIDLFEKLPVPFGLVRYGVAPDHPSIKFIADALEKTLDNPDIHLYCDVEFGVLVKDGCELPEELTNIHSWGGMQAATLYHVGKYSEIIRSHVAVIQWINTNGYQITGPVSEEFLISPLDVNDVNDHVTKIIMPIKKAE